MTEKKKGLYANIHAKQERIKHGSGEHMRKAGEEGAPSGKDFDDSAKTAKPAKPAKKSPAKKKTETKTKPKAPKAAKTAAAPAAKSQRKS